MAATVDPQGPPQGLQRVVRGESWLGGVRDCRSANRSSRNPDGRRFDDVGFRLAADVPPNVVRPEAGVPVVFRNSADSNDSPGLGATVPV